MNTLKTIGIAAVTAIVVLIVGFWLVSSQPGSFGATIGATFYPHSGVGARSLKVVTSTTDNTPAADGTLSVGGGSVSVLRNCTSFTYNPPSLANSATSTQTFATPIAQIGDDVSTQFATSTQGIAFRSYVSSVGTTTLTLFNPGFGTIDLATSTLTLCTTR